MNVFSPDKWIDLALDDLESAQELYAVRRYRNSYFLFQQSVEKANKAFGLKLGLLNEEDLDKDRHDQFKMYRRYAVKQQSRFSKNLINDKKFKNHKEIVLAFSEMITVIDSLRNLNLIQLQESELQDLLGLFEQMKYSDEFRKKLEELDIELNNEIMTLIRKLIEWMNDNIFILIRLVICAFITIQHSSKTRYPLKNHDPILTYTDSLPIIKMQNLFMVALRDALIRLKTFDKFKFPEIENRIDGTNE